MFTPRLSERLKSNKQGVKQVVEEGVEMGENPDELDFNPEPTLLVDPSRK